MEPVRPAAIVACGGFAAVAVGLAATASFWTDEGDTWTTSATSTSYFVDSITEWDSHAPVYFALIRAVSGLGDSELVLRLPSIVAGLVAVVLVGRLAEVLAGPRARYVGVLLGATNALLLYHASEARNYALTMALGAASTLALIRAADDPTRAAWARYALATSLLVLSHSMALTLVAAQGAWAAYEWWRTGRRPAAAAVVAWLVVAATSAVVAVVLVTVNTSETEFDSLSLRSPVVLVREVFGNRSWLPLLPASIAFLLGARAALAPARPPGGGGDDAGDGDGPSIRLLVVLTATLPIALLLAGSLVAPSSLAGGRYASPVVPAALAVAAAGIVGLAGRAGVALLCAAVAAGVAAQVQTAADRDFEDIESAMAVVRDPPDEASAVLYFDPYVAWVGAYYLRDVDADRRPPPLVPDRAFPAPLRPENAVPEADLAAAAADGPEVVWLVVRPQEARAKADDYAALRTTLATAGYEPVGTRRFPGVDVVELHRVR